MRYFSIFLCCFIGLVGCKRRVRPSSVASDSKDVLAVLYEKLTPYITDGTFSGTLSYVCSATDPVSNLTFGECDRENSQECVPETKFRIGSMSKSFTAAAILKLVEEKLLSLDTEVASLLPEYPETNLTHNGQKVLIRHLLSHTGGVPDWGATQLAKDRIWKSTITLQEILDSVKSLPLVSKPGEKYEYSNTGYALLALIVERTSNESFENYLKTRIFNKAELLETGISLSEQLGLAKGYVRESEDDFWYSMYDLADFQDRDITFATGSGSMYSTSRDIILWLRNFSAGKVVSSDFVTLAFTPNLEYYGFGWTEYWLHKTKLAWHNGALSPLGFSSEMGVNKETGFAYSLLTNVDLSHVSQPALQAVNEFLIKRCTL